MTSTATVGCPCQGCGLVYVTDLLVPDEVWARIRPEGELDGLLCPTCIMDRASDLCGWTVGFVYAERHGLQVIAGKPAATVGDDLVEDGGGTGLTPKFKVGDQVERVSGGEWFGMREGDKAVVVEVRPTPSNWHQLRLKGYDGLYSDFRYRACAALNPKAPS